MLQGTLLGSAHYFSLVSRNNRAVKLLLDAQ